MILITGASSDIGLAIVSNLERNGNRLILHTHSENGVKKLRAILKRPNDHIIFRMDFSEVHLISEEIEPLLKSNPIKGLVNCVAVRSRRPLKLLHPEHIDWVMRVNYSAFIELLRTATKKGSHIHGLSIVQISSISAQSGGTGVAAYAASKAAADIAVRSFAKELHKKGIRLNSILCGQVDTYAYSSLMNGKDHDPILDRQYLGLNKPEDISNLVSFLLSSDSSMISGQFIPADGGYLQ